MHLRLLYFSWDPCQYAFAAFRNIGILYFLQLQFRSLSELISHKCWGRGQVFFKGEHILDFLPVASQPLISSKTCPCFSLKLGNHPLSDIVQQVVTPWIEGVWADRVVFAIGCASARHPNVAKLPSSAALCFVGKSAKRAVASGWRALTDLSAPSPGDDLRSKSAIRLRGQIVRSDPFWGL